MSKKFNINNDNLFEKNEDQLILILNNISLNINSLIKTQENEKLDEILVKIKNLQKNKENENEKIEEIILRIENLKKIDQNTKLKEINTLIDFSKQLYILYNEENKKINSKLLKNLKNFQTPFADENFLENDKIKSFIEE